MICHCCSKLPLDLFLPLSANSSPFKGDKTWNRSFVFKEGNGALKELVESSAEGCQLCSLVKTTLDRAEPHLTTQKFTERHDSHSTTPQSPRGEDGEPFKGILFRCYKQGELVITDGERTGSMYWEMPEFGYGRKRGRTPSPFSSSIHNSFAHGAIQVWLMMKQAVPKTSNWQNHGLRLAPTVI